MYEIKVKTRPNDVSPTDLRQQGFILGEVYGHNKSNVHVIIPKVSFEKLFNQAGESNLIMLTVDEHKPFNVLIKDIQLDAVNDQVMHVDFYIVKMDEKLTTDLPLEFIGTAKAIKELGGILVKSLSHVPITCLPKDLVAKVEIDISPLDDFDKVITVGEITWPSGIEVLVEKDVPICLVQQPRVEAQPETTAETTAGEAGKTEDKAGEAGKTEDKAGDTKPDNK